MSDIRKLSDDFLQNLQKGFLTEILLYVKSDPDLDLQIRNNYLNIYFKGNSLLKLSEVNASLYQVVIHPKFIAGMSIPNLVDEASTSNFIRHIPMLKENILIHGKSSLEMEYEQLIIRANNDEPRNNSEYFIIDRQYADPLGRFDLVGIFWRRQGRKKGDVVPLCLMEVKFALNRDISLLHDQLAKYYSAMHQNFELMAVEFQGIFQQKLALGLFNQPPDRLAAMQTLTINPDIHSVQFIIFLVDFNPYSGLFERTKGKLSSLPFASQVRIFHGGFAMWEGA